MEYLIKLIDMMSGPAKNAGKAVDDLQKGLGGLQTAQNGAGASSAGLQATLAEMTGGLSVVVEVAGAAAVAIGALVVAGAAMAISASQAKAQMLSMFDALGEGKVSGVELDDTLDSLRTRLGLTKDSMVPVVKQLLAMGVTSKGAIEKMTIAAESAKALVGGAESGADAFLNLSKKIQLASESGQGLKIPLKGLGSLADMGITVDDVAKKMGLSSAELVAQLKAGSADAKKFGDALQNALIEKGAGPLQVMSLAVDNLWKMFREFIGDLHEDLGFAIDPFLKQVRALFAIFDSKASASGQALKTGLEAVLGRVFTIATKVVPMMKHFLLDTIIYGLRAYLALKPIVKWFEDLRKNEKVMTVVQYALKGVKDIAIALGVAVAILLAPFVALSAIAFVVVGALVAVGVAITGLVWAVVGFVGESLGKLYDWVKAAPGIAWDFISGLVGGLTGGAGRVVDAVKNLGGEAIAGIKSVLKIASPSKVMFEMGGHTAAGFAEGVEASAPRAQDAMTSMGNPPPRLGSGGSDSTSGPNITFIVNGVEGAEDLESRLPSLLTAAFERLQLQAGT